MPSQVKCQKKSVKKIFGKTIVTFYTKRKSAACKTVFQQPAPRKITQKIKNKFYFSQLISDSEDFRYRSNSLMNHVLHN